MWKQLIQQGTDKAVFGQPAEKHRISNVETALSILFPESLKELLLEHDGVLGEYGLGLIWPLQRIEADNIAIRNNRDYSRFYMPFDHLLFFADAGNGDQFAFPIRKDSSCGNRIFVWNHEDDSRSRVATDLKSYIVDWLSGELTI